MPKISKSKTDAVAETTSAITVAATTTPATTTPAVAAPKSKSKSKTVAEPAVVKVDAVVKTEPVAVKADAVVKAEPALDAHEGEIAELVAQSTEFLAKITQLGSLLASLKTEYRTIEKKWSREIKTAQKSQAKRKRKSGNRQPSGFVKPTKISDELAKFLEKPSGSEMARTEVTREINKYIRSNNLQDKENGRKINPDTKLQALLKLKTTDELTYFNLQRYMSPHFSKAASATA
jgi:chromatin remodeling complex protein RSC6